MSIWCSVAQNGKKSSTILKNFIPISFRYLYIIYHEILCVLEVLLKSLIYRNILLAKALTEVNIDPTESHCILPSYCFSNMPIQHKAMFSLWHAIDMIRTSQPINVFERKQYRKLRLLGSKRFFFKSVPIPPC